MVDNKKVNFGNLVQMKKEQSVMLGKETRISDNMTEPEYFGKFLSKDRNNNLHFGLCISKDHEFAYHINEEIDVAYMHLRMRHVFKARIIGFRLALPKEKFEIDMNNFTGGDASAGYTKYILEVTATTKPDTDQKRGYFRMPIQVEVYFRDIEPERMDKMLKAALKFEVDAAIACKKEAEDGILEYVAGYSKLLTVDLSAGGFMFKSSVRFREETCVECLLIIDKEALPAIAKILTCREDIILDGYYMHAQFIKISDPVRDRIIKYLIAIQKQQNARFLRR